MQNWRLKILSWKLKYRTEGWKPYILQPRVTPWDNYQIIPLFSITPWKGKTPHHVTILKQNLHTYHLLHQKSRRPITRKNLNEIHSYIGGIINQNLCKSIIIGGTANHIHILCELTSTVSTAMLLQEIKRSSSKWIKRAYPQHPNFAWQNGYAAFSVSQSKVDTVTNYIRNQKEHHTKKSFKEELVEFLKNYQIEYKEEYLWSWFLCPFRA